MNKRQELAMQTREKLINSAKKVIIEKGYNETSIEDITKEAKVATGTFYTYFKAKEDIISALGFPNFEKLKETTLKMNESVDKKLKYYFKEFMVLIEEYDIEICRQWTIYNISPKGIDKIGFDTDTVNDILKLSVQKGELSKNTPINELTHFIVSELYGMMLNWCMSNKTFEPLEYCDKFSDFVNDILKKYIIKN